MIFTLVYNIYNKTQKFKIWKISFFVKKISSNTCSKTEIWIQRWSHILGKFILCDIDFADLYLYRKFNFMFIARSIYPALMNKQFIPLNKRGLKILCNRCWDSFFLFSSRFCWQTTSSPLQKNCRRNFSNFEMKIMMILFTVALPTSNYESTDCTWQFLFNPVLVTCVK